MRCLWLFTVPALLAAGQATTGTFEANPATILANGKLTVTILKQGAGFAAITLADDPGKLNPLWEPMRMSRELGRPATFNPGSGHFICVDGFGPVSADEREAGLQGHGEAHLELFDVQMAAGKAEATMTAKLPIVQEQFTRTVRMVDGENVVYVDSVLQNLLGFDRPVNWAEHATAGSPFVESGVTVIDVSGSRSQTRPYAVGGGRGGQPQSDRRLARGVDFTWPIAPGTAGGTVDMRQIPENAHYIDHAATLLDPARQLEWVTALNPKLHLVLGYVFRRDEYPWLQTWGNYPATGKFSRGMEFGTQPYDVSRREAISTGQMFGTPTYRWLPAKGKIESRFVMFYAAVPEGFKKVDDVRVENGQIVIEDKAAGKSLRLAASLAGRLQ
ncbi:MAG TPA: hypothetical protein VNH18_34385 [Bryobacteraceae bacterium]|nr:hypothetical protein [Bryobacteraceae bacterium]